MAAYEEKIPVDEEAEQRQRSIMEEYKQKLIVCGNVMPDPFSLKDGWLAEKKGTGLAKWPSVYYMNIYYRNFFAKSISHQICYYVWSQTIKKAKHTYIINVNLLKKYFTTMCLLNQNTAF